MCNGSYTNIQLPFRFRFMKSQLHMQWLFSQCNDKGTSSNNLKCNVREPPPRDNDITPSQHCDLGKAHLLPSPTQCLVSPNICATPAQTTNATVNKLYITFINTDPQLLVSWKVSISTTTLQTLRQDLHAPNISEVAKWRAHNKYMSCPYQHAQLWPTLVHLVKHLFC